MANIDFAGFNFNPDTVKKFGWDKKLPTSFMSGINLPAPLSSQPDPIYGEIDSALAIARKYQTPPVDVSKLTPEDRSLYALTSSMRPDTSGAITAFILNRYGAKEAAEMQRKNYEFLSEQRRKSEQRKNLREDVRSLFNVIGRAASPIPYEMTQELAANIANISNPRNLSPQMGIQAASYSLPGRQYFA